MGARNKPAKKVAEKAAELAANAPVKRSDTVIVDDVKRRVKELTDVMNEADVVGLSVNFNIYKTETGEYAATVSISKVL